MNVETAHSNRWLTTAAGVLCSMLSLSLLLGRNVRVTGGARPLSVGPTDILVAALLGLALARILIQPVKIRWSPVLFAGAALSAWIAARTIVDLLIYGASRQSIPALVEVVRWFEYATVYMSMCLLEVSVFAVGAAITCFAIAIFANAGVALFQAATFNFGEARVYGLFQSSSDLAGDSVANANSAGALFAIGAVCLMAVALGRVKLSVVSRSLTAIGALMCSIAMLFTLSRSSLLGWAAGSVAVLLASQLRGRARVAAWVIVLTLAVALTVFVLRTEALVMRILETFDKTGESAAAYAVTGRLDIWREALKSWPSYWAFGIGFGRYPLVFSTFTADNLYLETFVTLGFPGLVGLLGLFVSVLKQGLQLRSHPDVRVAAGGAALLGLVAVASVVSATGAVLLSPRVCGVFWLASGLVLQLQKTSRMGDAAT